MLLVRYAGDEIQHPASFKPRIDLRIKIIVDEDPSIYGWLESARRRWSPALPV